MSQVARGEVPRDPDRRALEEAFRQAAAGTVVAAVVEGGSGAGTSALVGDFVRSLKGRRRARVVALDAGGGEGPTDPVAEAARRLAGRIPKLLRRKDDDDALDPDALPDLLQAVPVVGNLASALAASVLRLRRAERPHDRDRDTHGRADRARAFLWRVARRRTLVLVVDGGEALSSSAVRRLDALLSGAAEEGASLLVLVASRPSAPGLPDPPALSLGRLGPGAGVVRVRHRMVESRSGTAETEPEGGASATDLTRVPAPVREALQVAATLGDAFQGDEVATTLALDPLETEDRLAVAVHLGLLRSMGEVEGEDGTPDTLYAFDSETLRLSLLPPTDRGSAPRDR